MIDKNNTYFLEMIRIEDAWQTARHERDERKKQIIETCGWDSPELEAWYAEDKRIQFPFSGGEIKAYIAWKRSACDGTDELEMSDFLWEKEAEDFIATLRKAWISSFVYTNTSTAVMENIHDLAHSGCRLDGLCTIEKPDLRWGGTGTETVRGIHFTILEAE